MYILSRKEMTEIDRYVIDNYKIPGRVLMELAGKGCFDYMKNLIPENATIALFCGSGNNGGDGLVIARWLKNYHYQPYIYLTGDITKMSQETMMNYELAVKLNIPVKQIQNAQDWKKELSFIRDKCFKVFIDAIFGIGFKGSLKGLCKEIIDDVNALKGLKIAIDIASGLDADNGLTDNAFNADYTLTMAATKYGHYLGKGKDFSGKVEVIDIGVPAQVWQERKVAVSLINEETVIYPERYCSAHKGDYGRVAVIAGSQGYTGAAVLSCQAALKAGSGLITLYHPAGLETILESCLKEVMTMVVDSVDDFKNSKEFFNSDALLIGPGLRMTDTSVALVDMVTANWDKPAVLDADALNILAVNREWLNRLKNRQFVLTPHIGEFARLTDKSTKEIMEKPFTVLRSFVDKYRCSVLLKTACRIFADSESIVMDVSGNDGLATGGSGDVLAGIVASFLGQKSSIKNAAVAGSYLLGKTAEECSRHYMVQAVTPSMIIDNLFKKY